MSGISTSYVLVTRKRTFDWYVNDLHTPLHFNWSPNEDAVQASNMKQLDIHSPVCPLSLSLYSLFL